MIIKRPREEEELTQIKKWTLLYGRRKTGKTFLVENFLRYDEYYFINRDRSIISKKTGTQVSYDVFVDRLRDGLKDGKTIVVDEFHRLGDPFLDTLHMIGHGGRLVLLTSTLFMAKKMLSEKSPLLGLLHEMQIRLISLNDALAALKKYKLSKQELIENAIMLREPLAVDYFSEDTKKTFVRLLTGSADTVPALIGEIFMEEERGMSAVFEGVIRAVANGKVVSGEISSALYSRKLIPKDDPSGIQPYLSTLVRIGILKRLSVYGKKKFIYKVSSPLVRMFFYADEKYGIGQRQASEAETSRIIDEVLPHIVEDNIRECLAEKFGLEEVVYEAADYGVDGVLLRFRKPSVVLEVKWRRKIGADDIAKAEKNMQGIKANKRILFVQDKTGLKSKTLDIMDVSDF